MKTRLAILFFALIATAMLAESVHAQASAQDQATFDALFSDKIIAVRRSRDREDDSTLVVEMLDTAQRIPDSPGVRLLIYQSAIELSRSAQNYRQAIEVAKELRRHFPEEEEASDDSMLELFDTAYRGTPREGRLEIARPYIDLMLEFAKKAEDADDLDRASGLLRDALSVARAVESGRRGDIEERIGVLQAARSLRDQLRQLITSVEANPRNISAANELTMLLVLTRHDPALAGDYVEMTKDAELIDVVRMASEGVESADAPAALRVGDWYLGLSDDEPAEAEYLLGESLRYYQRFLEIYPRDDSLKTRVRAMEQAVTVRLEAIAQAHADAARGQWVNLIEGFNVRQDSLGDNIRLQGGHLYAASSDFVLDINPQADYELRIDMRFVQGDNGLDIYLPLGEERGAVFHYSRWEHTKCQIDGGGTTEDEQFMLTSGREVELRIEVQFLGEGNVRLVTFVDDEVCIEYEGEIKKLNVQERFQAPEEMGNIFRVDCHGRFVFRAMDIRELIADEDDSEDDGE